MNKEMNEKQMRKIFSKELVDVMKDKGIEDRNSIKELMNKKGDEKPMREIKFRAWDKDNIKMIQTVNMVIDMFGTSYYWIFGYDAPKFINPKDFELMQYTGLKDRKGKEIYEGDILKYKYPFYKTFGGTDCELVYKKTVGDVKFLGGSWIVSYFADLIRKQLYIYSLYEDCKEIKIVGNVCENPELMEKVKKP